MMKTIRLHNGMETLVDDEDFEKLNRFKWYALKKFQKYYAQRSDGKGKDRRFISIHTELIKPEPGKTIDHINGDSLDNQKHNLRQATRQQQGFNKRKMRGSSSIFKGVSFHKHTGKWQATIGYNHKFIWLGIFENQENAANAYDKAAREYFGEWAVLNFPDVMGNA